MCFFQTEIRYGRIWFVLVVCDILRQTDWEIALSFMHMKHLKVVTNEKQAGKWLALASDRGDGCSFLF